MDKISKEYLQRIRSDKVRLKGICVYNVTMDTMYDVIYIFPDLQDARYFCEKVEKAYDLTPVVIHVFNVFFWCEKSRVVNIEKSGTVLQICDVEVEEYDFLKPFYKCTTSV